MKVSQVLRSIKTQPQVWTLCMDNDVIMTFAYGSYKFGKFNKEYGGGIKLYNKQLGIEMDWDSTDPVGSQLWSSVIMNYVNTHIINK